MVDLNNDCHFRRLSPTKHWIVRISKCLLFAFSTLGSTNATAIINGVDVEHSSADASASLVALQMSERQADGSMRYYKGTSFLIAPDLLLTAGHNVAYIGKSESIEAIFSSAPCWGPNHCRERRIKASKSVVHPEFRQISGGTEFDIAIVQLSSKAPDDYQALQLANDSVLIGSSLIQVFGFGSDREGRGAPLSAFRLRSIGLTPLDTTYRLGSKQKFWFDQSIGGICGGDSGGPAILQGSLSYAIGLAIHVTYSEGSSRCLSGSAFTDLLFFSDWIAEAKAFLLRP
jgi:secreted trypsin-like serine protease